MSDHNPFAQVAESAQHASVSRTVHPSDGSREWLLSRTNGETNGNSVQLLLRLGFRILRRRESYPSRSRYYARIIVDWCMRLFDINGRPPRAVSMTDMSAADQDRYVYYRVQAPPGWYVLADNEYFSTVYDADDTPRLSIYTKCRATRFSSQVQPA